MNDKLLREALRVERDLVGSAHPLIVVEYVVKRGDEVVSKGGRVRETPLPHGRY